MSLFATRHAIGAVSRLLENHLRNLTELEVHVGRPESGDGQRLNLFLYEASFDSNLKNLSLYEGEAAPLWMVLKYLLTAYEDDLISDSLTAHELLGVGAIALQKLSYLALDLQTEEALGSNPETLKITFDDATSELLSRVMQGSDEKYRCSLAFQVRPVMIATGELPSHATLVGVDYTASPSDPDHIIGYQGIQSDVQPTLGPKITSINPIKFEPGDTVTLKGSDLNLSQISVCVGSVEIPVISQTYDTITFRIDEEVTPDISTAGSYPVSVVQTLPTGKKRSSNMLVGRLLPTLNAASENLSFTINDEGETIISSGEIIIEGEYLGTEDDDVFISLMQDGSVVKVLEDPTLPTLASIMHFTYHNDDFRELTEGDYRILLHVNGEQARHSPIITIQQT